MLILRKLPTGDRLYSMAQGLGVSLAELGDAHGNTSEPELQRRVLDASRARRDSWLWLFALVSAIAAAVSALAAWSIARAHCG